MGTFVEIRSREDPEWEDAACTALESGGVLVHPTTSVYGIGGSERRTDAIVARLKGRAESVPILRLVYDAEQLLDLAEHQLDRIQVVPLDILNQGQLQHPGVVDLPDNGRDGLQAEFP